MKKAHLTLCLMLISQSLFAADRALIIGVGSYQGKGIAKLPSPANDIKESQALARSKAFGFQPNEIRVLSESQATRANILSMIDNWLINGSKPGDNIYFYYSGHGTQVTDNNNDEHDGLDEVILPFDSFVDANHQMHNHITDDELRSRFDQLKNRNVITIFDSCNSGTVTRGLSNRQELPIRTVSGAFSIPTQALLDTLDEDTVIESAEFQQSRNEVPFIEPDRQRVVWSAVDASQYAYVDTSNPKRIGGKFTQLLHDGYVGKKADTNKNGVITNNEIFSYVTQGSQRFCNDLRQSHNACKRGMTPIMSIAVEQRNLKFGFSNTPSAPQQTTTPTATTVSDALPQQTPNNITLELATVNGATTTVPYMENIYVSVKSKHNGFLYLLDHDSDGDIRFLYPNGNAKNTIHSSKEVLIPNPHTANFELLAQKKGNAELVAVIVEDRIDTTQLMQIVQNRKNVTPKQLGDFVSKIQATYVGDRVNRPLKHSINRLAYTIK